MSWGGGGCEGKAARRLPAPQPDEKDTYKVEVAEEAGAFVVVADDVVQTQYVCKNLRPGMRCRT